MKLRNDGRKETGFLGLMLVVDGMRVREDGKVIWKEWPVPTILTDLGSFPGLLQLNGRLIKSFYHTTTPRTNLTPKQRYPELEQGLYQCVQVPQTPAVLVPDHESTRLVQTIPKLR